MKKINIGDRVQYSTKFLRAVGCYTGDLPFGRGIVTELIPIGGNVLCKVDWNNPDIPAIILSQNLTVIQ